MGETVYETISPEEVTVLTTIFSGGLFAEGYTVTLKYVNGTWVITNTEMNWISQADSSLT